VRCARRARRSGSTPRSSPSSSACARVDLFKSPGIAETIDWTNALVALNTISLDPENVQDTLGVLLKHRDDITKMSRRRGHAPARRAARHGARSRG
jgi:hypothetical protein